jgi:hypothetical protein
MRETHLIRVRPVTVREVPSDSDARKYIVTSRDGRFYQTVYVEGDGEPDLSIVRGIGTAWIVQLIAARLHAAATRA